MNPHLSVVAVTRNDDHGHNMIYRLQQFVTGFITQCRKHDLKAELILVEWNPPQDQPPLSKAVSFPSDPSPCTVRIIRVPPEEHAQLPHADQLPLFQMIGKNVGIRHARGEFVLATNMDILFSDPLMKFMKTKLKKGHLYRVDRFDVPEELPKTDSFDEILRFCAKNVLRINSICGTHSPKRKFHFWTWTEFWINVYEISLRTMCMWIARVIRNWLKKATKKFPWNPVFCHTNACGDFTLLAKEDWEKLRGYPEWPMYSWHIDSVFLHQARQHGIKEVQLLKPKVIYHIEHSIGSGYSPEGAKALFKRLDAKGIPYLSDQDLKTKIAELRRAQGPTVYNNASWGLEGKSLEDVLITG